MNRIKVDLSSSGYCQWILRLWKVCQTFPLLDKRRADLHNSTNYWYGADEVRLTTYFLTLT